MNTHAHNITTLFPNKKPVIACIHLMALPGSPLYEGNMDRIYNKALEELEIFKKYKADGIIIENFRDCPFYPGKVPSETIASMAAIRREIVKNSNVPVGINVLRNDAESALAIATAVDAQFIRVNVHMNVFVSDQGILEGTSYHTLRMRKNLDSNVLIFSDVGVKHAAPLVARGLDIETRDLSERGLVDALIVSGELTGEPTNPEDLDIVKQNTTLPIFIGSGVTLENLESVYENATGFIIGSYFKVDGKSKNYVDESRVKIFMEKIHQRRVSR
ncbi:MAG: BtpA/SgcQ family protein [Proteobacteria bacterium]|nr:BtpA/SgcQ family protein [Pseudomonadota bacterium]